MNFARSDAFLLLAVALWVPWYFLWLALEGALLCRGLSWIQSQFFYGIMAQNSGCLYVGDFPGDIVAGRSAGTLTVTGAGSRDALADFGPIRDLPAALGLGDFYIWCFQTLDVF
jgi:hypothetical protein